MPAPYDARKIANFLLDTFDSEKWLISNKKINKLLYFIHGVYLVRRNQGLIRNHFEAWDHGPVVSVVYHAFKECEFRAIKHRASALDYASNEISIIAYCDISIDDRDFILKVIDFYLRLSAQQLEDLTHVEGGPWWSVRQLPLADRGLRNRIPDDLIRKYFSNLLGTAADVN
jgi:uncharacterized phage-associated protein